MELCYVILKSILAKMEKKIITPRESRFAFVTTLKDYKYVRSSICSSLNRKQTHTHTPNSIKTKSTVRFCISESLKKQSTAALTVFTLLCLTVPVDFLNIYFERNTLSDFLTRKMILILFAEQLLLRSDLVSQGAFKACYTVSHQELACSLLPNTQLYLGKHMSQ